MANIQAITYEGILQEMMEKYKAESGFVPDDASDIAIRLRVLAAQIHSMAATGQWLLSQMFFDTATGEYLDKHAAMQGLTRNAGAKAEGRLTFRLKNALTYRLTVPAGTVCTVSGNTELRFVTLRDCFLNAGDTRVAVEAVCESRGMAGNVAVGTVDCIIAPMAAGMSVTNESVFRYGRDDEDDEGLRARIALACALPSNGTNAAYYKSAAMSVEGVGSVSVLPRNRGRGTVDVYVCAVGDGAETALLTAVKEKLDAAREIGVDVAVRAATAKVISPSVKLKSVYGYDFDAQRQKATEIVQDFFNHLSIGETFRYNQLGNRLLEEIEGLEDYDFGVTTMSIAVGETEFAKLGSLSVTEWGV